MNDYKIRVFFKIYHNKVMFTNWINISLNGSLVNEKKKNAVLFYQEPV